MGFAVVAAVVAAVGAVRRWRPSRVEVGGDSMTPTLEPGDWVLTVTPRRLHRGDVVVVDHPERAGFEMVKRITRLPGEVAPDGSLLGPESYWVEGDNPTGSTDSRAFGSVTRDRVLATAVLVYGPGPRWRIVRRGDARG